MLETAALIYLIATSPVQIILNEKVFSLDDKSSLPNKFHSPVPSAKTKFLYNSDFILFADLLYWKMTFFFLSLENGHWSRLRRPELQTDTAAQPACIFKCSSLTNRPFPYGVTEASEPATHLIPNTPLAPVWAPLCCGSHQTLTKPGLVPGLTPFCPNSGGKAPTGCFPKRLEYLYA